MAIASVAVTALTWLRIGSLLMVVCSASPIVSNAPGRVSCKRLPGDADWPSMKEWSQLNRTVGGRLIATVPHASVCHGETYDADMCSDLQNTWQSSAPQYVLLNPCGHCHWSYIAYSIIV